MDKEVKAEFERRDQVLDVIREEIDSLTGLFDAFKSETGTAIGELKEAQSSLQDSSDSSRDTARLYEATLEENNRLTKRVAYLESPQYQNEVIQGFLREIDTDNYLEIGRKLGYLEESEASPEDLENIEGAGPVNVELGDSQILKVQKEKPEDMTGWEYSETQGLYVKLESE